MQLEGDVHDNAEHKPAQLAAKGWAATIASWKPVSGSTAQGAVHFDVSKQIIPFNVRDRLGAERRRSVTWHAGFIHDACVSAKSRAVSRQPRTICKRRQRDIGGHTLRHGRPQTGRDSRWQSPSPAGHGRLGVSHGLLHRQGSQSTTRGCLPRGTLHAPECQIRATQQVRVQLRMEKARVQPVAPCCRPQ